MSSPEIPADDARAVLDLTRLPDDADRATPVPHLAFFEPRIAGNTGNAIRLAAVTGSTLHLVEPLGFDLSEPKLKRAGLDYHDLASVVVHPDLEALLAALPASRVLAFTTQATTRYTDVEYRADDVLLFGPEPTGLPPEVLGHARVTDQVRIPMLAGRRSLNLTSSASIVAYEAWRQTGFAGGA
ncbi:tRNA (cytidine/uridine-2'-O-)-methyltransferase [Sediminihabitans luteus]|uniref:Putative tRNA (cytidine(34)-2'-O)-methyltransferase n=1 Tax=Sediminihabitans luteus TaxID=1138585 RepID=A0A2M9CZS6_9CELL|nr:tRNA (cytidine/uridine-2'-O-)-methyltransferase [Sediminihabitans luteus]GII98290.1 putative tRNA (cytidine(34)-2'-O)-methyltransferase [Sediminihabitans luteus]